MAIDYDSPWKEALDVYFEAFVLLLFPDVYPQIDWSHGWESLDKEFQQIVREAVAGRVLADKLFKVWRKDGAEAWLLIHIEVQGQVDPDLPRRMLRELMLKASATVQQRLLAAAMPETQAEIRRVLAEATNGAHVLAFHRDQVARLEAITEANAFPRFWSRCLRSRRPGTTLDTSSWRHGALRQPSRRASRSTSPCLTTTIGCAAMGH